MKNPLNLLCQKDIAIERWQVIRVHAKFELENVFVICSLISPLPCAAWSHVLRENSWSLYRVSLQVVLGRQHTAHTHHFVS